MCLLPISLDMLRYVYMFKIGHASQLVLSKFACHQFQQTREKFTF